MGNNYDFSIQTNKNQAIKIKSYVDGIATISLGDNLTLGKSAREVELLFESDFEEQLNNLFPEDEFHGILCKIRTLLHGKRRVQHRFACDRNIRSGCCLAVPLYLTDRTARPGKGIAFYRDR